MTTFKPAILPAFSSSPLTFGIPDGSLWEDTGIYIFVPTAISWAGGVLTVTAQNHGLTSTDDVNFVSNDPASLYWNVPNVAATVIDKDTFRIPMVGDPGAWPNDIWPPINLNTTNQQFIPENVIVTVPKYTRTVCSCTMVQFETIPIGTTIQLQAKIHLDATWCDIGTAKTHTDEGSIYTFSSIYNFTRIMITGGTGKPTVFYSSKPN